MGGIFYGNLSVIFFDDTFNNGKTQSVSVFFCLGSIFFSKDIVYKFACGGRSRIFNFDTEIVAWYIVCTLTDAYKNGVVRAAGFYASIELSISTPARSIISISEQLLV